MKKIYLLSILLQLIFTAKSFSQKILEYHGDDDVIVGEYVSIAEDSTNKLDLKAVIKSGKFVDSKIQTPNLQLSESDFWLKFSLKNLSKENHLLLTLDYPTLDLCEFYFAKNGYFHVQRLSDNYPFYQRKYKHQNFIFDLDIPSGQVKTYYLRVRSSEQMVLPLVVGTPKIIAESIVGNELLWGLLIGLLFVMIFYNLFVYISTRDISYLWYVLYITFIGLTQTSLSGYTYKYLFQDAPYLFNKGIVIFPALAGITGMFFVKTFLRTKERTPRIDKVFPFIILLYCIAIVLRVLEYDHLSYRMIDISAISATLLTYVVAITISWQGYRPAKLFLVAWTIFFIGLILFVLRNLGILPYNDFTNYTMQVGTAFEVTLLSLALADRINIFKAEKERSQAETVKALQENERIIREQNEILEGKVRERTVELIASNDELHKTLIDLKEAESQLVESEKMASLGQLTAGIAHEINNPINFVTSNVGPLKRDVEILLDMIETMESVGLSDSPVQNKKDQIENYKEDIDFDYLKIEIDSLLKGIGDGASRTAEIIKGLRFFSRLDEDDLKYADINEGLESTIILVNNLVNNSKIKVVRNLKDLPQIECYPGKLNQVFLNIISNAIYAINKNSHNIPQGILKLTTEIEGDSLLIKIEDNGVGMDENTKKKIFEPFFTTKDVGEGTGLGMSITYNTIKRHNGSVQINSTVDVGTEFIIQLPTRQITGG